MLAKCVLVVRNAISYVHATKDMASHGLIPSWYALQISANSSNPRLIEVYVPIEWHFIVMIMLSFP